MNSTEYETTSPDLIPLTGPSIDKDDIRNVVQVLESGMLVQGRFVQSVEQLVGT